MRLGTVPLDASFGTFSQFVLEQRAQQPGGLPAFLVRAFGELEPQAAARRLPPDLGEAVVRAIPRPLSASRVSGANSSRQSRNPFRQVDRANATPCATHAKCRSKRRDRVSAFDLDTSRADVSAVAVRVRFDPTTRRQLLACHRLASSTNITGETSKATRWSGYSDILTLTSTSNWGSCRLLLRLPHGTFDTRTLRDYVGQAGQARRSHFAKAFDAIDTDDWCIFDWWFNDDSGEHPRFSEEIDGVGWNHALAACAR
jgi:hypothetical protein